MTFMQTDKSINEATPAACQTGKLGEIGSSKTPFKASTSLASQNFEDHTPQLDIIDINKKAQIKTEDQEEGRNVFLIKSQEKKLPPDDVGRKNFVFYIPDDQLENSYKNCGEELTEEKLHELKMHNAFYREERPSPYYDLSTIYDREVVPGETPETTLSKRGESLVTAINRFPQSVPLMNRIDRAPKCYQRKLGLAALIEFSLDIGMPEIIALSIHLKDNENLKDSIKDLRDYLKRKLGYKVDLRYEGVTVPAHKKDGKEIRRHCHAAIVGIPHGSVEYKIYEKWRRHQNRNTGTEVFEEWAYEPYGWIEYLEVVLLS